MMHLPEIEKAALRRFILRIRDILLLKHEGVVGQGSPQASGADFMARLPGPDAVLPALQNLAHLILPGKHGDLQELLLSPLPGLILIHVPVSEEVVPEPVDRLTGVHLRHPEGGGGFGRINPAAQGPLRCGMVSAIHLSYIWKINCVALIYVRTTPSDEILVEKDIEPIVIKTSPL
jgi:hypothetical protein